ncbi:MAG: hypothetical protein KF708_22485 [Pirellulales bacterium]|nr:hypothetical protein [Pirellulales bacterium]
MDGTKTTPKRSWRRCDDFIVCVMPACRECGSIEVSGFKGKKPQGDGTFCQYTTCASCQHRFKIVWVPPSLAHLES